MLDHAGGKVVEGLGDFLQILIEILHGDYFRADYVAVDAGDGQAAFRIGDLFIALLQDFRIDYGAAEAFEVIVNV